MVNVPLFDKMQRVLDVAVRQSVAKADETPLEGQKHATNMFLINPSVSATPSLTRMIKTLSFWLVWPSVADRAGYFEVQ